MSVPASWSVSLLEEVVEIHDDLRQPVNAEERTKRVGEYPYYGATGQVGWIDDYLMDGEYILLGEDGAPFLDPTKPKAYRVDGKAWVNNHAHVLRGIEGLLTNRYLLHALNCTDYREFANGTTRLKLTQGAMRRIPLPIAPLPEQHRIVEKIEELFSDLDAGVASLQRAKANLKRYRASVLKSAVEGRLTEEWRKEHPQAEDGQMLLDRILRERREKWEKDQLQNFKEKGKEPPKNWESKYAEPSVPDTSELPDLPEGWVWATVEQVCLVRSGQTPPDIKSHLRDSGEVPWFTVGDMNHEANALIMTHADKFLSHSAIEVLGLHVHPPRTIIFPKRGGAIATNKKRQLATASSYDLNTMGIIPPDDLHTYVWLWFLGVDLRKFSDGSNVPQINHNDIEPLPIPLPPLAEQEQIVALVEERLSQIDSAEKTIDSELIRSKRLRQSILKRAFEGKLVPQDPKDEPASVLLERIKASREAEQPKRKAKKATKAKAK